MRVDLRAAERHTYVVMCEDDPRWVELFNAAPKITTTYHGPLPPGPVAELTVMFIVRTMRSGGYDETVYFANVGEVTRWNNSINAYILNQINNATGETYFEQLAKRNPEWTVSQILDYVGA